MANEVWQQHCYFELVEKDAKAALSTMSDDPHVLMEPLAIDGRGREGVYNFYHEYSLAQLPADMTAIPISQVAGENILAEEGVYQFTHDQLGTGAGIFRQSVCAPPAKREHPGVFNDRFALRAESSAIPKEPNVLYGTAGAERLATHGGSVMMAHSEAGW